MAPVSSVFQSEKTAFDEAHFRCLRFFQLEAVLSDVNRGSAPSFVMISPVMGFDELEGCRTRCEGSSCVVR